MASNKKAVLNGQILEYGGTSINVLLSLTNNDMSKQEIHLYLDCVEKLQSDLASLKLERQALMKERRQLKLQNSRLKRQAKKTQREG